MTSPDVRETSRSAFLAYWLCLALGLTAACALMDVPWARAWALATGTVAGAGLGQLCASGRYRLWAAMAIGATALFFAVIVLSIGQAVLTSSEYGCLSGCSAALARDLLLQGSDGWLAFMAYVPAGLSGYLFVTEYGSFASLWIALAFWMLPILEPSRGPARPWMLVVGAMSVLLLSLYARERRRVAVWRTVGAVRLSPSSAVVGHRRSPLQPLYQALCLGGLSAVMLSFTGWLAPHLWQRETSARKERGAGVATGANGGNAPCCPSLAETTVQRPREYFPLLTFQEAGGSATVTGCITCASASSGIAGPLMPASEMSASASNGPESSSSGTPSPPVPWVRSVSASTWAPPAEAPRVVSSPHAHAHAPEPLPTPPAPTLPATAIPPLPTSPAAHPPMQARAATLPPFPVKPPPAPLDAGLLARALFLTLSALLSYLAVRPARRWVTLRHLRRPLWSQSKNEEISNGWQWILISLRDAGWEALPEERPRALARRVEIPGVLDGATVLERARYGLRITEGDVAAMGAAARAVQAEARGSLGHTARALSWFRWPLV